MLILSNSKLSKLKDQLSGDDVPDYTNAIKRGRLLDALVTSPDTVNSYNRTVTTKRDGVVNNYTAEEMKLGYKKRDAFMADSVCKQLHETSNFQVDIINEAVEFDTYVIACRAIYDGMTRYGNMPWDLKSTNAGSQAAFNDVFHLWDWDRQAFFFMEVCGADRMLFVGVENKKPFQVYKKMIMRGDAIWLDGREKTFDLVEKFIFLCANE